MRQLIFSLAFLIAMPAMATEVPPDSMLFGTYNDMVKQLRANGVEPTLVPWAEVNPLCVGFMNYKDDQTVYNRCLFDKAVLATAFATDRETCDIESLAITPESLRNTRTVVTTYLPGADNDEQTTIETPKMTRRELKTSRAAAYNRCMKDNGWKSPRDWRLGYAQ